MLLFALLFVGCSSEIPASGQERPYSAVSPEVYTPPVVRPFEPPSGFGRQEAEGDADLTVARSRPIAAPVMVEAYRNTYEPRRSRSEVSYEQGVEAARRREEARMGPLDGLWRVVDARGVTLLDLVLSDRAGPQAVEGAISLSHTDRAGIIDAVSSAGDLRIITAVIDGREIALRLRPRDGGWAGDLAGLGADQDVTLIRENDPAP